jgi:alkylation response protein AidB-like acyl-CoA dehydrogenase
MAEATLQAVLDSVPLIRAEAAASEAAGRLTEPVVQAMRRAGVFGMTMSRELGGPQLTPLEQIEVIEALAAADGSAGWCGMINSDGGYITAFFDRDVARALYPTPDLATVFVATPALQARIKGDSYVVSGEAPFASGSTHADWFFINCMIMDDDGLRMAEGSSPPMPETRVCALAAGDVEVLLGTWQPTGLTATASHNVRVHDVVVPAERTFSIFAGLPVDPAPLYSWRWTFFVNMPGVPLGIARAALEEAKEVAQGKVIFPDMTLARDDGILQWNIGRAEALVGSARAYVFDAVGRFWDAICAGRAPSPAEWTAVRLAHTNAMHSCKEAVTLVYEAMGTTGVYRRSPLDRQLRDVTTMAQHILGQTKTYANCGRGLLGVEPGGIAF